MSSNKSKNSFEIVPNKGMFRGLKKAQRQELLAMQQWLQEGNPDAQELAELAKHDEKLEILIAKCRRQIKPFSRYQRQRDS